MHVKMACKCQKCEWRLQHTLALFAVNDNQSYDRHYLKQAIDDPSSNQFRDPPTYTHQPSMQQKVPFSLIRCSSSKVAFCSCVEWGWHIYNIVESESDPLTRRAVDLFEKEPLKGNSEVHLHTPTKFGEDRSKDLGGDREQTDRQTNRQTDKRCSIYSMMLYVYLDYNTSKITLLEDVEPFQFLHSKVVSRYYDVWNAAYYDVRSKLVQSSRSFYWIIW